MTTKILYYAINGTGLGHLMRVSSIVNECRKLNLSIHQLIITNSKKVSLLQDLSIPFINLPCTYRDPITEINRQLKCLPYDLSIKIIYQIINEYKPTTIVFDTHFNFKLIRKLKQGNCYKLVLILRLCDENYMTQLINENILDVFDLIILPHNQGEVRAELPTKIFSIFRKSQKVVFSGAITRTIGAEPIKLDIYEEEIKIPEEYVLITCGAGGYQESAKKFLALAICASQKLVRKNKNFKIVVVGGPYLKNFEPSDDVLYFSWLPNLQNWISKAKLVISHAGYNTVHEIISCNIRAVFIPLERKHDNQLLRARYYSHKNSHITYCSLDTSPLKLAVICENILNIQLSRKRAKCNGVHKAAKAIISLRNENKRVFLNIDKIIKLNGIKANDYNNLFQLICSNNTLYTYKYIFVSVNELQQIQNLLFSNKTYSSIKLNPEINWEVYIQGSKAEIIASSIKFALNILNNMNIPRRFCSFIYEDKTNLKNLIKLSFLLEKDSFNFLIAILDDEDKLADNTIFGIFEKINKNLILNYKIDITSKKSLCLTTTH